MKSKVTVFLSIILIIAIIAGAFIAIKNIGPDGTNADGSTGSSTESTEPGGTESGTDGTESNPGGTTGDDATKDPTEDNSTISGTETTEPGTETTEPDTGTTEPDTETTVPGIEPSKPNDDTSDETQACAHSWSNWTTKAATCTSNGTKTRTCANCKQVETQTIPETGHSWGSWSVTTKATCDKDGVETRKCSNCGKAETHGIEATGHKWDEGKVTTTPTSCSDVGVITYTCENCGKTNVSQVKGEHSFGAWTWEEYTYKNEAGASRPSHRKVRSCTKCVYKEYGNTPDHYCAKGSANHTVSIIKEPVCSAKGVKRSTCKICGWYVDFEYGTAGGAHTWVDNKVHLSDYTQYTNELDATISTCSGCGIKSVAYHYGKGYNEYHRFKSPIVINVGDAYMGINPLNDNMTAVNHPTWQMVTRDYVYDSEGYVKQFTVYWHDKSGNRYSQVIKCDQASLDAWFAEYDLTGGVGKTYQLKAYMGQIIPYGISWQG